MMKKKKKNGYWLLTIVCWLLVIGYRLLAFDHDYRTLAIAFWTGRPSAESLHRLSRKSETYAHPCS